MDRWRLNKRHSAPRQLFRVSLPFLFYFLFTGLSDMASGMAKKLVELLVVLDFTMFWTYMPHKLCFSFWISRILLFDDPPTNLRDFMWGGPMKR